MAVAVVAQGGSFLTSILLARILGRSVFGQYGLIQNTVVTFSSIAVLGLGITATRYVSHYRGTDCPRAGRVLGLCTLMAVVSGVLLCGSILGGANLLASELFKDESLTLSLRFAAAYVFFNTLGTYQAGVFAGLGDFRGLARVTLVQALAWLGSAAALTSAFSLAGSAAALAIGAAVQFAYGRVVLNRALRKADIVADYRGGIGEWQVLGSFALPAAASAMIGASAIWLANTNLVRQRDGFSEMAIVGVGSTLRTIVLFGPTLANRAIAPALSSLRATGGDYRRVHELSYGAMGLAAALLATIFSLSCGLILKLYGHEFASGIGVVRLFIWTGVLEVLATTLYQRLFVHAKMWWQFWINCAWAGTLLGVAILGGGSAGASRLAVAYAAAWTVALASYAICGRFLDREKMSASQL